jgi:2-amino-4-hydroxy-6-hydroxymethyldihydropteridine diphosphokinase
VETEIITTYIGLGSNQGYRAGNILLAVRGLMEAGFHVSRLSALYETEPVGVKNHDPYLNMVAEVGVTNITPSQMLARMVRIEYLLGRRHKYLKSPRTIDLDLLFYGNAIVDTVSLTVPHSRLTERKFVLVPMVELAPDFVHPVEHKTVSELLETVADESSVTRWNPDPAGKKEAVAEKGVGTASN